MAINKVVYGDQVLIDLTGDTVTADKLLSGFTAHGKDGSPIEGRAPRGARGLKWHSTSQLLTACVSRPARGAWIEILLLLG